MANLARFFVLGGFCLAISACSRPVPGAEFNDPYEEANRAVHADNVKLDSLVFGSVHPREHPILPKPIAQSLSNAAANLGMPGAVINSVLQFRPGPALQNTLRFAVNSTIGLAGLFDPASSIGIYAEDTDFGETLHVWGAPEGAFIVVPVMGPTTERDLVGSVVDLALDPLGAVGRPESYYIGASRVGGKVGDRSLYSDLIDPILYESADSYAQMRLLYLQNRHHQLGIEEDVFDPYEDPYGQ
ncbi:MAG: VacJ family lipoprotein [Rhodobacteraceae bacterium]|nr:VacJ family lipoprotein [Paracoccaceae bacterium]